MINSRRIEDLRANVQPFTRLFIEKCHEQSIDVIITSTLRDFDSQNALYAQGRTTAGKIVTNAKAGYSFHNYGVAFDFTPIIHGKPAWDDTALFTRCGVIAESVGLEWAGRWKSFRELAHCQFTGGKTIRQLLSENS
jgi:peptidoglycan L-alanyl-D-glutamate endopeptidase CwlK